MNVINLSKNNSAIGNILAELRSVSFQKDKVLFRRNVTRIGNIMAYEVSKSLSFSEKEVQTCLGVAKVNTYDDRIVLGTIFRAGLPFHQGFLDLYDNAENAFVSAYRYYKDEEHKDVGVKVEYLAAPSLQDKTLILVDPMLATGYSLEACYEALCQSHGKPSRFHICSLIASEFGIENLRKYFKDCEDVTVWCAAIDSSLNEHAYIVPGLGDAGDLLYGEKM